MTKVGERVVLAPACAHDDAACVRILTESCIVLWRHLLLYDTPSRSYTDGTSWNSHPRSGGARQHRLAFPSLSSKSLHLWYPVPILEVRRYYFKFPFREEHIFFAVTRTERRGHLDGNKLIGLPGNHITQVIDAPVIFRLYTGLTTINLLVLRKL